ncbi:hypothetical protein PCASD_23942 [Puccinia coronata f. sp. avenae]|uniref:Uncharacterized protein n=1 Tax=Puccinia coronata f. sp. avenae TaxID=200324 RepID=A0A2N5SJS9_9BASI|nr:hypothetical protein PCASD_23942 [Puccinia coronata f. sp. avenae]
MAGASSHQLVQLNGSFGWTMAHCVITTAAVLSGARTAVFDRWSDRHCLTKAPAGGSDRPVRSVPGTGRTGPAGTGRTNLSDQLALASVGQCPFDHRSNTAAQAPLKLPCLTG